MQNKELSNLEPKMSYLCNFGLYIFKNIAIFEISTKLVKMQSSAQRQRSLNLGQKMLFKSFDTLKCSYICNEHPQNCEKTSRAT